MKKIGLFIFSAFTVVSLLAGSQWNAFAVGFPDVDENHPHRMAIDYLRDNGVIQGYPDGTYGPGRTVNRAELLKILIEGSGYTAPEPVQQCFPDVPVDAWFAKYVCYAKERGWVEGYADGNFRPEQTVNKVEALKMLGEIQGWILEDGVDEKFSDVDYKQWYAGYLRYAETKGFLPESDVGNRFDPTGGMTRATIAENMFRTVAVIQMGNSKFLPRMGMEVTTFTMKRIEDLGKPKIVINELSMKAGDMWLELYNTGTKDIDVSGWKLALSEEGDSDDFEQSSITFPELTIPSNRYLLVLFKEGKNDFDFSDGMGTLFTPGKKFSLEDAAVALFDNSVFNADSMVDFMHYCYEQPCTQGLFFDMAVDAGQWREGEVVWHLEQGDDQLLLGRDRDSTDNNSASDWFHGGGVHSGKPTPGEQNLTEENAPGFDDIGTSFIYDESGNEAMQSLLAGFGQMSVLVATNDCDPVDLLKQAIEMMKDSCLDGDLINDLFDNLDTSTLSGTQSRQRFMGGSRRSVTSVPLASITAPIEIRMGNRGNSGDRGQAHVQSARNGSVLIELNLDQIDCSAEKMKAILFHELVHEAQLRRQNYGIWNTSNARVTAPASGRGHGTNHVDPATMVADCMEVEAHMRTAECIQKEQLLDAFDEYEDDMEEMLRASKRFADRYLNNGQSGDSNRKGCLNYINTIQNNLDHRGRTIRNQDWLNENTQIWGYLQNWKTTIQGLDLLFYEKFFASIRNERTRLRRLSRFVTAIGRPATRAAELIDAWPREQAARQAEADRKNAERERQQAEEAEQGNISDEPDEDVFIDVEMVDLALQSVEPIPVLSEDSPTCEPGETVRLGSDDSFSPGGNELVEREWEVDPLEGDSSTSAEDELAFVCPDEPGQTFIELRLLDEFDLQGLVRGVISTVVNDQDQPPVAVVDPPNPTCTEGETIVLVDQSYDPLDREITRREWFYQGQPLGDKNALEYNCQVTTQVELRVYNDLGQVAITNEIIRVNPREEEEVVPPPVSEPPAVSCNFQMDQLHNAWEDTPHKYNFTIGGCPDCHCQWTFDCGYVPPFWEGPPNSIEWRYDNWECGDGRVQVFCFEGPCGIPGQPACPPDPLCEFDQFIFGGP